MRRKIGPKSRKLRFSHLNMPNVLKLDLGTHLTILMPAPSRKVVALIVLLNLSGCRAMVVGGGIGRIFRGSILGHFECRFWSPSFPGLLTGWVIFVSPF